MKKEKLKRIAKRITAFAAAVAMAATFTFPAEVGDGIFEGFGNAIVASAETYTAEYDISVGSVTIDADGTYRIYGSTTTNTVTVAKDVSANITLAGVNIDVSGTFDACAFKIADNSTGNVTITLADGFENTLKSGNHCAGLQKNGSGSGIGKLTIKGGTNGTGKLTATGGDYGAGIGGEKGFSGSNIEITGGTVTAIGGDYGAGIGGGSHGSGSYITISGGTVTATGGLQGAGIGGGDYGSDGSNITISGGTVTAIGGDYGAGIGGGDYGSGSDITISGGTVIATSLDFGAGIGGGSRGSGSDITISGGTVTATGGEYGAGIGGGSRGSGSDITISGGTVTANGGDYGAGIGGGDGGSGSDITISGGTVTATGSNGGAGIGSGYNNTAERIRISGGSVYAKGGAYNNYNGADIGNGVQYLGSGVYENGTPVIPTNGTNNVYLLTIENPNSNAVTIDGNSYIPVNHKAVDSNDGNLYAYLPAKTSINYPLEVKVGTETTKYIYDTTNSRWLELVDIPAEDITVFTYTGSEQIYTIAESDYYTVSGNKHTDAGTYTVTVSLKDKDNTEWNNGSTDDITFDFVIHKAIPNVTAPTATAITYGQALSASTLSDTNWSWVDGTVIPTVQNSGYAAKMTVDDNNYDYSGVEGYDSDAHTVTRTIAVTVNKATPTTVTEPTATAITYGQALSASTLSDTNWSWEDGTAIPSVINSGYPAEVTVDDIHYDFTNVEGYNSETHSVTRAIAVTVNPATPVITVTANPDSAITGKATTVTVTAEAKNPNNDSLNDVPTPQLSYKIGNGAETPINGGTFVIPANTPNGTIFTIIAGTPATAGYYIGTGTTTITVADCTHPNVLTTWKNDATHHWHECPDCGAEVDKAEHTSNAPATETSPEVCNDCGYEMNPALGHIHANHLTPVLEVPETCTTDGVKAHYECDCGKLFADDQAATEVTADDLKIAAHHSYGTDWVSDNDDDHYHVCSVCGDKTDITAHSYDSGVITTPATEQTTGIKTYTCSECNHTKTEIVPKLNHTHVSSDDYTKDETGHWHTCSGCTEKLDFGAHTYGKWKITVPAGAQSNGKKERSCTVCGYVQEGTVIYGGDETTGDMDNATDPENNACHADLELTDEDIINKIPLTPEELEAIENGADLEVYMVVIDYSGNVPSADKALAEKILSGDMQIGMYIDVTLFVKVGDNDPRAVTETNGDLKITFEMPEKLINTDTNVTREYSIIRVHSGEAAILDCAYDNTTAKGSFVTDKFSTYAIAYKDITEEEPAPEPEPEPEKVIYYPVITSGNVVADKSYAAAGQTVNVKASFGYDIIVTAENGRRIAKITEKGSFTMPACKVSVTAVQNETFALMANAWNQSYVYSYDADMNKIKVNSTKKRGVIVIDLGEEYAGRTFTIYSGRKSTKVKVTEGVLDENGKFVFEVPDGKNYTLIVED